jgi:hypothetical protein
MVHGDSAISFPAYYDGDHRRLHCMGAFCKVCMSTVRWK